MYLAVIDVKTLENYKLLLTFENQEKKVLDFTEFLEIGRFKDLKDKNLFNSVKISFDTIEWANHIDLDPEFLYQQSKKLE